MLVGNHAFSDSNIQDIVKVRSCRHDELNCSLIQEYFLSAEQINTIKQLDHERYCYREMVNACPDYIFVRDKSNRIVFANTSLANLHELTPAEMIGKTYAELTGDVEGGSVAALQDKEILESGVMFYTEEEFYNDKSGVRQWNRVTKKRIDTADSTDHFILGVATHLAEWKIRESQLQESEIRFAGLYARQQALARISEAISRNTNVEYMLSQVAALLPKCFDTERAGIHVQHSSMHVDVAAAGGRASLETVLDGMTDPLTRHVALTGFGGSSIVAAGISSPYGHEHILYAIRQADAEPFNNQDAEQLAAIANQCLVSITKSALHEKILHQAHHDYLTGLSNRRHFEYLLAERLKNDNAESKAFSLLFLDLNGFKQINDNHGHLVGDCVLEKVADRLSNAIAGRGMLARMGGDEFSLILENCSNKHHAEVFVDYLLKQLEESIEIDSHLFSIGVSIGVALYPDDGSELVELVHKADSAMYHAKASSTLHMAFFDSEIEAKAYRRQRLEKDLADAIRTDQLELYYQPQFDLKTKFVSGVEALARWHHPELGNIPPDEFIGIAEQGHLIHELGQWVMTSAFKQAKCWQDDGYKFKTAINISPRQCEQVSFSANLLEQLRQYDLNPNCIEVEITESSLIKNLAAISEHLRNLRSNGISVSIDDFGTGYSSLGYLQNLPLDVLKIDRCFVSSMNIANPELSVITYIAQIARGFGLETVVEGVETKEQVNAAASLGCDYAQGWYFEKALPVSTLTPLLAQSAIRKHDGKDRAA